MVFRCCVPSCRKTGSKDLKMHRFPPDEILFSIWIINVGNTLLRQLSQRAVRENYRVCHTHFSSDYHIDHGRRGANLKAGAIPTLLLPNKITECQSRPSEWQGIEGSNKREQHYDMVEPNVSTEPPIETVTGHSSGCSEQLLLAEDNNNREVIQNLETFETIEIITEEKGPMSKPLKPDKTESNTTEDILSKNGSQWTKTKSSLDEDIRKYPQQEHNTKINLLKEQYEVKIEVIKKEAQIRIARIEKEKNSVIENLTEERDILELQKRLLLEKLKMAGGLCQKCQNCQCRVEKV